ncbi:MAG: hypothetical protein COB30_012090 [Ectothiorhodospiraceae bacterium]|nr:hypothetical protein [Ectothiorhodospiraceae bacterium]
MAEYNGLLQTMVNPAVMLSPLTNQEAVLSSRIEGTQATIEEVLEHEAGETYDDEKQADITEIPDQWGQTRSMLFLISDQSSLTPLISLKAELNGLKESQEYFLTVFIKNTQGVIYAHS